MATVGQRIKAAQAQKGISVPQIAALPGRPAKFGAKTIGRVIRGQRELQPHEAEWLGQVLGVSASFFFEDPSPPGTTLSDRLGRIEEAIAHAVQERDEQARKVSDLLEVQNDLLAKIVAATERGDKAADRIETATQRADEVVHRLDAAVRQAGQALRAGTQGRKPKAPKRAPKRTPEASPPDRREDR